MPMPHTDWELTIVDAAPPVAGEQGLGACAVGDIDGDGQVEQAISGYGALLWYRPLTGQRGVITVGSFHVGLELEDIDGDGKLEVITPVVVDPDDIDKPYVPEQQYGPSHYLLAWYKPGAKLEDRWSRGIIDFDGPGAHDLLFVDIDGDGRRELIANNINRPRGLYIYKPGADVARPWGKHVVQAGYMEEGLAVGDFDGDGKLEIASGVHVYHQPEGGPYAGLWRQSTVAPSHREMCRVKACDVNGNGRSDLVIVDSEYLEGQLSWFESTLPNGPGGPIRWIEHPIERGIYYGHSLEADRDARSGRVRIFLGEMAGGGWNAPYNYDARLMEYVSADGGRSFAREILYQGAGTHEATRVDIDGDGVKEIVGKEWRKSRVHYWKKTKQRSPITQYQHQFIDLDKSETGIDILAVDIDGDGRQDVVCGTWWYQAPHWKKYCIEDAAPGISQIIQAADVDGDGRVELIGIRRKGEARGYDGLTCQLVCLRAVDPVAGRWEVNDIGEGVGDWPHGSLAAPLLPGGKFALVCSYHSAHSSGEKGQTHFPELFEVPADPMAGPWKKRTIARIAYGEELLACDIAGNGRLDVVAGAHWLENHGDGTFTPHQMIKDFYPARVAICDITGNGKPDIVVAQEAMDYPKKHIPYSPMGYLVHPDGDPRGPWELRVIDRVRCGHSIGAADLDGDGESEIIVGEHDPFYPYRQRCKLYVYKKADTQARTWRKYALDDRFEHHDGTKIIDLGDGRKGIISHGWQDNFYVHLWAPRASGT